MSHPIYDASVKTLDGEPVDLNAYRGQVLLVVNTASKCGFTPQYKGLQELHEAYSAAGLVVLGFPCNQFGKQEPGSSQDIADFCANEYQVTFPIHEKIEVNGKNAHPLFEHLKDSAGGLVTRGIKWNFTKFLISRDGEVLKRFAPNTSPAKIEGAIQAALGASALAMA
jgi:glutathione peroxidase